MVEFIPDVNSGGVRYTSNTSSHWPDGVVNHLRHAVSRLMGGQDLCSVKDEQQAVPLTVEQQLEFYVYFLGKY